MSLAAAVVERRSRRAGLAVAALAVATLAANLWWIAHHVDWLRPLEAGQPAPLFELPVLDAAGHPGPDRIALTGLRGKIVVLDFWATWCGPCRASLPRLAAATRRWDGRVVAIAVNLDDGVKARAFFRGDRAMAGGGRLILAGDAGDAAERYQVDMLPHSVVIDGKGVVRLVVRGGQGAAEVEGAVDRLLAEPSL